LKFNLNIHCRKKEKREKENINTVLTYSVLKQLLFILQLLDNFATMMFSYVGYFLFLFEDIINK